MMYAGICAARARSPRQVRSASSRPRSPDSEPLLHPRHAGQDLLRHDERIGDRLDVAQADVACLALLGLVLLAEVLQQGSMPASRRTSVVIDIAKVLHRVGDKIGSDLLF